MATSLLTWLAARLVAGLVTRVATASLGSSSGGSLSSSSGGSSCCGRSVLKILALFETTTRDVIE